MDVVAKRKRCPNGSRKNRKTGDCEKTGAKTPKANTPKVNTPKAHAATTRKRCPNGSRKRKKTGVCESKSSKSSSQSKSSKSSKSSSQSSQDWTKASTKIERTHNGKKYVFIVIPKNTHVYRGFQYGSKPRKNYSKEDIEELNEDNETNYNIKKKGGLYFATLPIACYYAYDNDNDSRGEFHHVMEYKTKHAMRILDMSVWQNIKNVVDDGDEIVAKNNSSLERDRELIDDVDEIFNSTHGFNPDGPSEQLVRDSGGADSSMTRAMFAWLSLSSSPKLDGFGHLRMSGFHSEFATPNKTKSLQLLNEYGSDNKTSREMRNVQHPDDTISLENMTFTHNGDAKPFNIVSLLN